MSVAPFFKALLLKNLVVCVMSLDNWCGYGVQCSLPIVALITLGFSFFLGYA